MIEVLLIIGASLFTLVADFCASVVSPSPKLFGEENTLRAALHRCLSEAKHRAAGALFAGATLAAGVVAPPPLSFLLWTMASSAVVVAGTLEVRSRKQKRRLQAEETALAQVFERDEHGRIDRRRRRDHASARGSRM